MITPAQASEHILQLIDHHLNELKVIPVLIIENEKLATDLAKTLVDAGLPLFEVALRTPTALKVIENMAKVDGAIVAAGTVLTATQAQQCKSAGAEFIVSPGYTESLINASTHNDIPLLPAAATASEMMYLSEIGYRFLKFFPADINGGLAALKAFAAPLAHLSFCPTGGINPDNLKDYLNLANVVCAGGSWLVSQEDLNHKNWRSILQKIEKLRTQ